MARGKPPPRILTVAVWYAFGGRYTVEVTTTDPEHPHYDLSMTPAQYRATRNAIADTGSAPIPTGEHA